MRSCRRSGERVGCEIVTAMHERGELREMIAEAARKATQQTSQDSA